MGPPADGAAISDIDGEGSRVRRPVTLASTCEGAHEMKPMLSSMSLAVAALLATALPGYAAGPYDGTWVADAPAAGGAGAGAEVPTGCQAVRLPFKVTNNQISGNLARSTYGTGRVQASPSGAPITGTVRPDGTFTAQWQNYRATGKLAGDKVEVHWSGECGPRVATGTRVATAAGESAGATVPPAANPAAPYDGTWVFDAPAAGGTGQSTGLSGCEALRLPLKIVNNQVTGSLERSRYGNARVEPGKGPRAQPVTGSVTPDGTLTAQWEGYRATGKMTGNTAQLQWRGQCGQRVATGTRMVAAGESAGSSTGGSVGAPPPGSAYRVPQGTGPQGVHH